MPRFIFTNENTTDSRIVDAPDLETAALDLLFEEGWTLADEQDEEFDEDVEYDYDEDDDND